MKVMETLQKYVNLTTKLMKQLTHLALGLFGLMNNEIAEDKTSTFTKKESDLLCSYRMNG